LIRYFYLARASGIICRNLSGFFWLVKENQHNDINNSIQKILFFSGILPGGGTRGAAQLGDLGWSVNSSPANEAALTKRARKSCQ